MPISGVTILVEEQKTNKVLAELKNYDRVTTYGIHKNNYIVAVLEANTVNELEVISNKILDEIDGVLGVYPAYVNYQDDDSEK